jgi:type IV secretory pathway VirB9-like protein
MVEIYIPILGILSRANISDVGESGPGRRNGPDGAEMVNYRVKGDMYIVDRLFNRAALIVGVGKHARKVEITRKTEIGVPEKKAEAKGGGL